MKKAAIWGAAIYGGATLLIQLAVSILPRGEDALGLLLLIPWVVVFCPLWLAYHLFRLDWGVGEYGSITTKMPLIAVALNLFLGALIGMALRKLWQVTKKLFTNNSRI